MNSLRSFFSDPGSVQTGLVVLALTISLGLSFGRISVRGIRLGVAGVLFAGLGLGHVGLRVDGRVLEFMREAGLILFVFAVGLTIGPGFFNSFKRHGLRVNALASAVVVIGAALTLGLCALTGVSRPAAVGIFCGATTNTPSLGAATEALRSRVSGDEMEETVELPSLAYAATYPFGILGVLAAMTLLRAAFRVDLAREARDIARSDGDAGEPLQRMSLRVTNRNLEGVELARVPGIAGSGVVVSRLEREGRVSVPSGSAPLRVGDLLLAVGRPPALEQLRIVVGERSEVDLMSEPGDVSFRWLTLSRKKVVGLSLDEWALGTRVAARVTRIRRAEIEMPALASVRLSLGDQLLVVGSAEALSQAAIELGDAPRRLEQPELVPLFVGIVLGIILGGVPWSVPGLSVEVRLGLAGGPLIVAMVLARLQRVGPLVWYLPRSASLILKELGISLFLASVGLGAGDRFVQTLLDGPGLLWMGIGAAVTLLPVLAVGAFAMRVLHERYLTTIGVLAGSMTDPPSLAFANAQSDSEAPSIAYASVYPLSMILRIVCAQLMIVLWAG